MSGGKGMNRKELKEQIERLRAELTRELEKREENFTRRGVVKKSQRIDELILEYQERFGKGV